MGTGEPVIMLHGLLTGSLATWYYTVAPTIAQSHRVTLFDLRGHGRSERVDSGYDVQTMTGDLDALIQRDCPGPVTLIGHSYGALIALRYTIENPDRVKRLILVELPLPPSRVDEVNAFVDRPPAEMVAALPEALQEMLTARKRGRRARRFLDSLRFLTTECSLMTDLAAEEDIADADLCAVRIPVLGVFGNESSCRPVGDRLVQVLPDFRLTVLNGGHYLPLEATGPLCEAVNGFLNG